MAVGKTLATNTKGLASDMNTIGQWGLAAAIPATGDVVAGSFYYETDTKKLKQEQNGSWADISGADLSTTDAVVGDVKSGKTFFASEKPIKTGGLATRTLNPANETVQDGYYVATTLSAVDADLAVGNIKKDINIFGKVGTLEPILTLLASVENAKNTSSNTWQTMLTTTVLAAEMKVIIAAGSFVQSGYTHELRGMYNGVQKWYYSGAGYYAELGNWSGDGIGSDATAMMESKITNHAAYHGLAGVIYGVK